jgi:hypothetical protein
MIKDSHLLRNSQGSKPIMLQKMNEEGEDDLNNSSAASNATNNSHHSITEH